MIELRRVSFWYVKGRYVLRNINLSLRHKAVAILGPNASGKTTLMKLMALILKPVEGRIYFEGRDLSKLRGEELLEVRRRVVYVHEKPILLRGNVLSNVAYGLILRGFSKDEALSRAEDVLEELDLRRIKGKNVRELSAGQAQLVAIARAIAVEPKYLLLDEPTANLDVSKRQILVDVLRKRKGRMWIAVATHDYLLPTRFCEYYYELSEGVLVREGPTEKLVAH